MIRSALLISVLLHPLFAFAGAAESKAPKPLETAPPPTIYDPKPTVTADMADPGGKLFGHDPDPAKTRHYYIAAEPVLWNFAPEGQDPVCGKTFPPALLLNRVSWKIRYVQYTDATFSARVLPDPRLGILGPVLRGVTGENIAVTFLNRAWLPLSMHPHGVRYDKDSEGSYYKPNPGLGAAVAPGARFTYVWQIDAAAGPSADEPSSKAWLYHSHVTGDGEANLGLVGFIVVTDPTRARADGTPKDVDREMGVLFKIFEESSSDDAEEEADERPANTPTGPVQRTWSEIHQLQEENERHTLNGLTFGNLPGLEMNEGEHVRWYLFGLGSESDFHTAHWHGLRALDSGHTHSDVVELLPGSMKIADTLADAPGDWLFHCHVAEHMENGMFARVKVYPANQPGAGNEPEKRFFGLPQSLQTLRVFTADYTENAGAPETYFDAQVTVPDPYVVSKSLMTISLNGHSVTFTPDSSGISAKPEGVLLVKNLTPYGNGNVIGGTLKFEVTLKGKDWWKKAPTKASAASVRLDLEVGPAHHTAEVSFN